MNEKQNTPTRTPHFYHVVNSNRELFALPPVLENEWKPGEALRQTGPTLEEYVTAGYKPENYPPTGYAPRATRYVPKQQRVEATMEHYAHAAGTTLGVIQTSDPVQVGLLDQVVKAKCGVTEIAESEYWNFLGVKPARAAAEVEPVRPPIEPLAPTGQAIEIKIGVVGVPATHPVATSEPVASAEAALNVGPVKVAPQPAKQAKRSQHKLP